MSVTFCHLCTFQIGGKPRREVSLDPVEGKIPWITSGRISPGQ